MLSPAKITTFKNVVLGRRFELSLAWVTPAKMKALSKQSRGINAATDILSFPLSKNSGEIILCKSEVAKHAKAWGAKSEQYLPYLVIHGMVHLKGYDHGRIMDGLEHTYCAKLGVVHARSFAKLNGTKDRSGHRRGHVPSARRRSAR